MRSTGVREQIISFSRENWQMQKMYVQVSARLPWNPLCCLSPRCCFRVFHQGYSEAIQYPGLKVDFMALLFCLLSTPAATALRGSLCQVGHYSGNLSPSPLWTADNNSQVFVACKILWSSPGRGDGNGATHLSLSPAVVVHIPIIDLGAISPSLLRSQMGMWCQKPQLV